MTAESFNPTDASLRSLIELSTRLGRDHNLIQGAGGNTSQKINGRMWIKASGRWLEKSFDLGSFTPVCLSRLASALLETKFSGAEIDVLTLVPQGAPRPSLELAIHGLLSQDVVLHVHSVAAIAHAVRFDALAVLDEKLRGLNWCWIPYGRPGRQLAAHVETAIADKQPDILVLANHGLVVQADAAAKAEQLLAEVEKRLAIPVVREAAPDVAMLEIIASKFGLNVPSDRGPHLPALFADITRSFEGALIPDQVVYLGRTPFVFHTADTVVDAITALRRADRVLPSYWLVENCGVLLDPNANRGVEPMLDCLGSIIMRLGSEKLRFLSAAEEAALFDSEAEQHRLALAKA